MSQFLHFDPTLFFKFLWLVGQASTRKLKLLSELLLKFDCDTVSDRRVETMTVYIQIYSQKHFIILLFFTLCIVSDYLMTYQLNAVEFISQYDFCFTCLKPNLQLSGNIVLKCPTFCHWRRDNSHASSLYKTYCVRKEI